MGIIFDKTEATGGFGEAVQAHYEAFDFAAGAEEGVDLFFGGVEGEVSYVEGCGGGEFFFQVRGGGTGGSLRGVVVALAFFVL